MGMSHFDDDDNETDNDSGSINQIRKALREAEKRNKSLEDELSSFRTENRKRSLTSVIKERGLNPKIAAFVPSDIDADDLDGWLDEYGDVFGTAPAQEAPASSPEVHAPEGADTFNSVSQGGTPPSGDLGNIAQLIAGAQSKEDLDKILFGKSL